MPVVLNVTLHVFFLSKTKQIATYYSNMVILPMFYVSHSIPHRWSLSIESKGAHHIGKRLSRLPYISITGRPVPPSLYLHGVGKQCNVLPPRTLLTGQCLHQSSCPNVSVKGVQTTGLTLGSSQSSRLWQFQISHKCCPSCQNPKQTESSLVHLGFLDSPVEQSLNRAHTNYESHGTHQVCQ